jgi:hypothetical protein
MVGNKTAPPLEWRLQAAAVKRLKHLPGYGVTFTIAGDMNGVHIRSITGRTIAKATGRMPGEPDLRVYMAGGSLGMIEYKRRGGKGLSDDQIDRHALFRTLGFTRIETVTAADEQDAGDQTESIVLGWLASNDNETENDNMEIRGAA